MKGIHADREQMTSPLGRGVVGGRDKEEASGERLDFFTTFFWMPSGRSFCIQGYWVARAGHVLALTKVMEGALTKIMEGATHSCPETGRMTTEINQISRR